MSTTTRLLRPLVESLARGGCPPRLSPLRSARSITAILIYYRLSKDYTSLPQSLQSLNFSQPGSLWVLPLSVLLKPGELLVLLIIPGPGKLIRFGVRENISDSD